MVTEDTLDEMSAIMPELVLRRPIYQQEDLHQLSQYSNPQKSLYTRILNSIKRIELKSCLQSTVPLIGWFPQYHWKRDIYGDVIAGITVAVMHIPQGMAYAILGNVPPITGIYMAFFPVLVYSILGTSRHNSMGTFAVLCMMTGKVVLTHCPNLDVEVHNSTNLITTSIIHENLDSLAEHLSPIQVASTVTFMVGLMQLTMYFLRLGIISTLLSETLVSGFTTGAAIHVLTSQIKDLFGLNLSKRKGIFKVIFTFYDIFRNIDNVNTVAMVISAVTIITIVFNNEVLKPRLSKRCSLPIPIEMIVIILGTVISIYTNLEKNYDIITVGNIPVGLPDPKLPPLDLLPSVAVDSFVITMVSYTISMSMALILCQKQNYEIDSNQELMAQGAGNLVGSFFSCMPFGASLSRSLIQQTVGGRTQLASFISCGILFFVLIWIGPFFEPLPKCVLASIIVVALKGMLVQIKEFFRFLRLSYIEAIIWMITFLIVIIFDIEYGLLIGSLLCLANLLTLSMRSYSCRLALLPGTELYLDTNRFKGTTEIPGLKIFHYCGGLNFASRQGFRKDLYKIIGIIPQEELLMHERNKTDHKMHRADYRKKLKVIVVDFSSLMHIDPAGVITLRSIVDEFRKIDVLVYIAGCSSHVYETIRKCNIAESIQDNFFMFPTVNDAVNFAGADKNLIHSTPISISSSIFPEENCVSRL